MPPQLESGEAGGPALPFDWDALFREAELDVGQFTRVEPRWTPPTYADTRSAWENDGYAAERVDGARIEAGSYRGRAVYFAVLRPWTKPARGGLDVRTASQKVGSVISLVLVLSALVAASAMGFRNVRDGRGDIRGATRVGLAVFFAAVIDMFLLAHAPGGIERAIGLLFDALKRALFLAFAVWLLYLALEPIVRRPRPGGLVAWTRLLAGRWRDPLVGRDLLVGSALGALLVLVSSMLITAPRWLGLPASPPQVGPLLPLVSARYAISGVLDVALSATYGAMILAFFASMGSIDRDAERYGPLIFFGISLAMTFLLAAEAPAVVRLPIVLAYAALYTIVFVRFGLLAGIAALFWNNWEVPLPAHPSAWWGASAMLGLVVLLVPAVFGAITAMRGRMERATAVAGATP